MNSFWLYLFVLTIFSSFGLHSTTLTVNGSVAIHSLVFDKIIHAFDYVLVKFDEPFSHGEKEDIFKEIAKLTIGIPNLLTTSVGVADYGDKENLDLATKFGITKANFPAYRLFHKDADSPIVFTGEIKVDAIKMFIIQYTGVYIGLEGCLEDFDLWARQLVSGDPESYGDIVGIMTIRAAELEGPSAGSQEAHASAEKYLKIAQKIQENGIGFVKAEQERLRKLSDGNISDNKKLEIKLRLNILQSFVLPPEYSDKQEL